MANSAWSKSFEKLGWVICFVCVARGPTVRADVTVVTGCEPGCSGHLEQCGGIDFVGFRRCCVDGEVCVRKNEHFSGCRTVDSILEPWEGTISYCDDRKLSLPVLVPVGVPVPEPFAGDVSTEDSSIQKYLAPALVPSSCGDGCVRPFGQCGGILHRIPYSGPGRCCDPMEECFIKSEYYSQCRLKESILKEGWSGEVQPCGTALELEPVPGKPMLRADPVQLIFGQIADLVDRAYTFGDTPLDGSSDLDEQKLNCTSGKCVRQFGPCGGEKHTDGNSCCDPAFQCVEKDRFFSQCLPISEDIPAGWSGETYCKETIDESSALALDVILSRRNLFIGQTLPGDSSLAADTAPETPQTVWCSGQCAANYKSCWSGSGPTRRCCDPSHLCIQTRATYAQCRPQGSSVRPGMKTRTCSRAAAPGPGGRRLTAKRTSSRKPTPRAPARSKPPVKKKTPWQKPTQTPAWKLAKIAAAKKAKAKPSYKKSCLGTGVATALGKVCIHKVKDMLAGPSAPLERPDTNYLSSLLDIKDRWHWVRENGAKAKQFKRPRAWIYVVKTNYGPSVNARDQDAADKIGEALFQATATLQITLSQRTVSWKIKNLIRRILPQFKYNRRIIALPESILFKAIIDYEWNYTPPPYYRVLGMRPLYHEHAADDMFDTLLHELSHYMTGANEAGFGSRAVFSLKSCVDPKEMPYWEKNHLHNCVFHNIFHSLVDTAWRAGQIRTSRWLETTDAPIVSYTRNRFRPSAPKMYL